MIKFRQKNFIINHRALAESTKPILSLLSNLDYPKHQPRRRRLYSSHRPAEEGNRITPIRRSLSESSIAYLNLRTTKNVKLNFEGLSNFKNPKVCQRRRIWNLLEPPNHRRLRIRFRISVHRHRPTEVPVRAHHAIFNLGRLPTRPGTSPCPPANRWPCTTCPCTSA